MQTERSMSGWERLGDDRTGKVSKRSGGTLTGKAIPHTPRQPQRDRRPCEPRRCGSGPTGWKATNRETFEFTAALIRAVHWLCMGPLSGVAARTPPLRVARAARRLRRNPQRRRAGDGRRLPRRPLARGGRRCSSLSRGASPAGSSTIAWMPRTWRVACRTACAPAGTCGGDRPGLIEQGDAIAPLTSAPFPTLDGGAPARLDPRPRARSGATSEVLGLPCPILAAPLSEGSAGERAVESWAGRLDGAR